MQVPVPPNETPEAVTSVFATVTGLLSAYGWTILFLVVVLNLLWSHFYPKYKQWKEKQEDQKQEEEYKKNPEIFLQREEGLQRARQRLLEKHEELDREHAEKMRLAEERKRQEKIEQYERLQGKSMIKPNEKKSLRNPDYNPLTGSGAGCSYRPSRRDLGGAGGG